MQARLPFKTYQTYQIQTGAMPVVFMILLRGTTDEAYAFRIETVLVLAHPNTRARVAVKLDAEAILVQADDCRVAMSTRKRNCNHEDKIMMVTVLSALLECSGEN